MDFTVKYTANNDEKILIRKINDLIRQSEKNYAALYSGFLSPAEQTLLSEVEEFWGYISFSGGYADAERRLCRVCANEYAADDGAPLILYSLKTTNSHAQISHRDVLGSLMGLGIKREMVGDIMAADTAAQFFCHACIADFVKWNFKKIGRYPINLQQSELSEMTAPQRRPLRINISSMRLDCICAECFDISRTKAAESIKKGSVTVNWLVCDNNAKEIKSGDKIAMRGKGKVEIVGIRGISKKGRLFVDVLQYV